MKLDVDQLRVMCSEGRTNLWLIYFPQELAVDGNRGDFLAALVTEIQEHVNGWKAARIIALGGRQMERWVHLISGVEEWAVSWGCDSLEIVGRKGWGKLYPEFEPIEYVYAKGLKHG
jgi:hypothetical protein